VTGIVALAAAVVQTGTTFDEPNRAVLTLLVFGLIAFAVAGGVAVAYRWYFRTSAPDGIAIAFAVGAIALYLNTASLGTLVAQGEAAGRLFDPGNVLFNVVALGLAAAVAPVGNRAGDLVARNSAAVVGREQLGGEMSRVVKTVGRMTAVELPPADEIADIDGYDPVPDDMKATMADRTLLFPRRLTVAELRDRLVARLEQDYGIGHVDVDLADDGSVEHLSVGLRAAGLGHTLPPGTAAIAITADPAHSATPGDVVQIWRSADRPEPVAVAELRATAGDLATVALDETDAGRVDQSARHRLVTLPAETGADREFAALLRNADETMGRVAVEEGSPLVGRAIAALTPIVAAVGRADGGVDAVPPRDYPIAAGETLYLVGRPDTLRRVERESRARTGGSAAPAGSA